MKSAWNLTLKTSDNFQYYFGIATISFVSTHIYIQCRNKPQEECQICSKTLSVCEMWMFLYLHETLENTYICFYWSIKLERPKMCPRQCHPTWPPRRNTSYWCCFFATYLSQIRKIKSKIGHNLIKCPPFIFRMETEMWIYWRDAVPPGLPIEIPPIDVVSV